MGLTAGLNMVKGRILRVEPRSAVCMEVWNNRNYITYINAGP